jgi:uncharacterized protein
VYLAPDLFTLADEHDDSRVVFAPLLGVVARVNLQMADLLEQLRSKPDGQLPSSGSGISELIELGLLSPRHFGNLIPRRASEFSPTSVSLFLTGACNLACVYCHSAANSRPATMTLPMAKSAIELVAENAARLGQSQFGVTLHGGGEPTLCWQLFRRAVKYARELAARYKIAARVSVGTNGVLTSDSARWLAKNVDEATLSIDGLRQDHDQYRFRIGGQSSYDRVLETARDFEAANLTYGVRLTVARSWVQRLPLAVEELCTALPTPVFQAEPLFAAGRAKGLSNLTPDPEDFIKAFRQAARVAWRYGRRLKYSGARLGTVTDCFCNAVGHSFAVTPTGEVTCCFEVTGERANGQAYIWGRFDANAERYVFDEHRRLAQIKWSVHEQHECANCFCKWTCAGDCPAKRDVQGAPLDPQTRPRCIIARALTHDQLIAALRRGKEISFMRTPPEGTCT